MSRIAFLVVVLVAAVAFSVGCKKPTPCEQLIEKTCASSSKEECANVKLTAGDADEAKNKLCGEMLPILPDRSKPSVGCDLLADMVCSERPLEDCLNMRKEAVGADVKKAMVCDKFKQMILDTRKYNQDAKAAQKASDVKAPPAQLARPAVEAAPEPAQAAAPEAAPAPAAAVQPQAGQPAAPAPNVKK